MSRLQHPPKPVPLDIVLGLQNIKKIIAYSIGTLRYFYVEIDDHRVLAFGKDDPAVLVAIKTVILEEYQIELLEQDTTIYGGHVFINPIQKTIEHFGGIGLPRPSGQAICFLEKTLRELTGWRVIEDK